MKVLRRFSSSTLRKIKIWHENFIYLNALMEKIYNKLSSRKELMTDLYGINYDGVNYYISKSGGFMKREFKLLAYTIKDADIINEI